MYSQENRDRIHEQIRAQDAELDRRLRNDDNEDDQCEAEEELWDRGFVQIKKEYEALPPSGKQYYEQQALEAKYETWRRFREMGRLIENDESGFLPRLWYPGRAFDFDPKVKLLNIDTANGNVRYDEDAKTEDTLSAEEFFEFGVDATYTTGMRSILR